MADRDESYPDPETSAEPRSRTANPSIRVLARCLRRLDEVLESDYSFLHCSPERLRFIWNRLTEVRATLQDEVEPLLAAPSHIPRLEAARQSASDSLQMLSRNLLSGIDRYPRRLVDDQLPAVRRLLCATTGQIHAFLADTLSELLTAELGQAAGSDYWLSRRLPRDIEESQWLAASVDRLDEYLRTLEAEGLGDLRRLSDRIHQDRVIPEGRPLEATRHVLDEIMEVLAPRLRAVRALQGIRYDDMEVLDRYLLELPVVCQTIVELQAVDRELAQTLSNGGQVDDQLGASSAARALLGESSRRKLDQLDQSLRDLIAFVGLWSRGIRQRRALRFRDGD